MASKSTASVLAGVMQKRLVKNPRLEAKQLRLIRILSGDLKPGQLRESTSSENKGSPQKAAKT